MVNIFDQLSYTQMSKSMHHVGREAKSNSVHMENTCTCDLITAHFCTLLSPFLFSSLFKYSAHLLMAALNPLQLLEAIIKVFYSPTDAQANCLKNNFKTYIKIDIKTAPTCFGAVTPSSGSTLLMLAKVTVVKIVH